MENEDHNNETNFINQLDNILMDNNTSALDNYEYSC